MKDLFEAFSLIEQHPQLKAFIGPKSSTVVAQAEQKLGIVFPPTYRQFLETYGAGGFGSVDFYGIVSDDFDEDSIPDMVWCTLDGRGKNNLPHELVVVGSDDDGGWVCLNCKSDSQKEAPIIEYVPGFTDSLENTLKVSKDFGKYLYMMVRRAIDAEEADDGNDD